MIEVGDAHIGVIDAPLRLRGEHIGTAAVSDLSRSATPAAAFR